MTRRQDEVWVGFDLGGTKMLASVFDSSFEVIGRSRRSTLNSVSPKKNLKRIAKTIDGALDEAGLDRTAIRGIGIGCPGPVDMTTGLVHEAINLGWRDVPVGEWLTEKMNCPVQVVNDVDAGVYGEFRFGSAQDSRCVVGIFPGTGIGGGCIYEGRILRGHGITCMEIGHFPIDPGAPARGNGRCHTLEHVSSRLSIAAASAQAAYRGHAPHLAEHVGTEVSTIRSGALRKAIESGDTVIQEIVREAAEWIGVAAAGLVHLLAPDTIVLGGGLVEAMPDLFRDAVSGSCRKNLLESYRDTYQVVTADLGDDASVLGAAAWAETEIVNNTTRAA
ncbi:MAG: ROK family protein [Planctomycetota bacterium]|nr:ROK family protein [Planctomycetota bacterium]